MPDFLHKSILKPEGSMMAGIATVAGAIILAFDRPLRGAIRDEAAAR